MARDCVYNQIVAKDNAIQHNGDATTNINIRGTPAAIHIHYDRDCRLPIVKVVRRNSGTCNKCKRCSAHLISDQEELARFTSETLRGMEFMEYCRFPILLSNDFSAEFCRSKPTFGQKLRLDRIRNHRQDRHR
ncbi:hypothetical protein BJ508DRAFT_164981 [Ascobolus immersus RN42]|uniref:Uncharacterized protein n=1 Tax=Ascobolus immersus RN42 TaxID=1160509 RepID=A0A3N4HUZ4_ASCIM|nr:hypothetical protein BJ508DRAFT_164981 [Ascobolus immersus RN42]